MNKLLKAAALTAVLFGTSAYAADNASQLVSATVAEEFTLSLAEGTTSVSVSGATPTTPATNATTAIHVAANAPFHITAKTTGTSNGKLCNAEATPVCLTNALKIDGPKQNGTPVALSSTAVSIYENGVANDGSTAVIGVGDLTLKQEVTTADSPAKGPFTGTVVYTAVTGGI